MEHLYQINLNKGEDKLARVQRQMELQRWMLLVLFVVLAGGETFWIYSNNGRMNDLIAQKESEVAQVQAELQKLQTTGQKLSKRDIMNLARLEESRLLWSEKMEGLGEEVSRKMALTDVRFEKGHLYIVGVHKVSENLDPIDEVMRFVDRLKANEKFNQDFVNIQFASSEDIVTQDQPALRFEIQCRIEPTFLSKTVNFSSRKS